MNYRDDKELDEALRSLAKSEWIALPEGLDERLSRCLRGLPEKKNKGEHPVKSHTKKILNRTILVAAVLALMVGCLAVGALAFGPERVVEKPVPQERQEIVMEDIGLTVVLPDSWKGRYYVWSDGGSCYVFNKLTVDWVTEWIEENPDEHEYVDPYYYEDGWPCPFYGYDGLLFGVARVTDVPMTKAEFDDWVSWPAQYLFTTEEGVYAMEMPSDVQSVGSSEEDYREMESEFDQILFILNGAATGFSSKN